MLLTLKIESYDIAIRSCLEYLIDKKPKGKDLILVKEQRILYTQFRDELTAMKTALS